MEIIKAIESADALCSNPYTYEEKIGWCDEVSGEIRRSILKQYNIIESTVDPDGNIEIPDGLSYDMIETAFIGGKRFTKEDFRSIDTDMAKISARNSGGKKIKVVYLDVPKPIRIVDIKGEFNTSENVIEMSFPPFVEGDKIEIVVLDDINDDVDWNNAETAYVIESSMERIILDRDAIEAQTDAPLAIRRIVTDCTEIDSAPYDRMYVEYLLAKFALYQHDYVAYNAHMTQYNSLFESARREYITRNPLTEQARFKNYSNY